MCYSMQSPRTRAAYIDDEDDDDDDVVEEGSISTSTSSNICSQQTHREIGHLICLGSLAFPHTFSLSLLSERLTKWNKFVLVNLPS